MQFFIEPVRVNNNPVDMMKPETLMAVAPDYYGPRLDAIAELRAQDDGSLHKGNEFRRVASLVNVPLVEATRLTQPGFFKDKKQFYRWLKTSGRPYMTYNDKGRQRLSETYVDGKPVL